MQKLQLSICCIFLSAFLASCGQSNIPPVVQTDSVPDTSTQITLQERKDYDVPKPKKDWIEALNTFATDNPAFAGYDFSADRKELIFYVAEKHKGQKSNLILKNLADANLVICAKNSSSLLTAARVSQQLRMPRG